MRTTVDIRDPLLERAKKLAAQTNRKLGDIVNDALLEMFDRRARQSGEAATQPTPTELPTFGKGGVQPGVDLTSNAAVQDILDGLDEHEPAKGLPRHLKKLR